MSAEPVTREPQDLGTPPHPSEAPRRSALLLPVVAAAGVVAIAIGLLAPSAVGPGGGGMSMTHYMELLAARQPWNLLLFMAVPVILAETLAISEFALLFGNAPRWVKGLSRAAGLVAGPIMLGILAHLTVNAVLPLTAGNGWRGPADVIAVLAYLLGAVPLVAITLIELGLLGRTPAEARRLHWVMVATFLVVAHVAMIIGMLDPTVLGWSPADAGMGGMSDIPGMNHGG